MQIVALTKKGNLVRADEALHHVDYLCPECLSTLRLRRGEERIAHFFHKKEGALCRLRHKDGMHRNVQLFLIEQLGEKECSIECHFPEINRIADVTFHPKKIVFEIQLSPISKELALERTMDYWSIGWHVIWILHAKEFGKRLASPFERSLLTIPHYFTNVMFREGCVWDELSFVQGRRRHWFSFPPNRCQIDTIVAEVHRSPPTKIPLSKAPKTENELIEMRQELWDCSLKRDDFSVKRPTKRKFFWKRAALFFRLLWYRTIGFES